jgi:predicted transcriptional regulator
MASSLYDMNITLIPSTSTGTASTSLGTSITAPIIISTITLDTITPVAGGGSVILTQNISSIGPTIVQSSAAFSSTGYRYLFPVINTDNTVSLAELYYISSGELPDLEFTAVLKVVGT